MTSNQWRTLKKVYARAGRVRLLGLSVVGRLSNACPEFFQPFGLVLSMNDAAEEPERFGNIVAVEADVLTGRLGILPHPLLDIVWLGEDVGCMAGLRHLDDYGFLEIENMLGAEHVHRPRAVVELLVVVEIVVRAPGDLRHVKVAGQTEIPAQPTQFASL